MITSRLKLFGLIVLGIAMLALPASAEATFAGAAGRIVFSTNRDGNNEIYTEDLGGGSPTRLTNNSASDSDPCIGARAQVK